MTAARSRAEKGAPRIHLERSGRGPALVLTHGLGDTSATWGELLPALSPHFEILTWDLLGHGSSAKPESDEAYSRDVALADLDAVIAAAGGDVVLVGHSLGGYLSQCRAVRDPNGIRALVLIATGPGYRDPARRDKWNRYAQRAAGRFDIPDAAVRMVQQHDDLVMANLEALRMPILQIVGEKDTAYHAALSVLERRVPDVQSLTVPGAGHHVHRSHADAVAAPILAFLRALPGPGSAGEARP